MPLNLKRQTPKGEQAVLPDGVYRVVIEAVESKPGPSGFNYLNMRLRPYVNGVKHGQAIWDKISLSPDARFRVDAFLDAIDAPEDGDADEKSFVGKSYWASVKSKVYEGRWSNEIKQYLSPEAAESILEKQAREDGSSNAELISSERKSRPVAEPAAVGSKRKAAVAGVVGEGSPF
jgi:hypothetical protein